MASNLDTVWVLVSAALVMSMQIGFCMLEAGLVRSKNTINVAMKNLMDFCVASLLFWAVSYALMYGLSQTGWVGTTGFFFDPAARPATATFFLFQMMFCATAATIVSGAVAERMSFSGYLIVTALVSGLIYPIAGGWAWNESGWLKQLGFVDFAGSTVVHSIGGWVSLSAVLILGPRAGRYHSEVPLSSPHSLGTSTIGVLVLFVGWLGFNGGSKLALVDGLPGILINTTLAGCAGCLVALLIVWSVERLPRLPATLNGCIGGLVAVTASCHAVDPWAAVLIGAVGGAISYGGMLLLDRLYIDDAVGASAAHAFPGIWGTLAVALFGDPNRLDTGLAFLPQLKAQLVGIASIALWAGGVGWLLLRIVNRLHPLRIDPNGERVGLNVAEHGASTEIVDLLGEMSRHSVRGEFTQRLEFMPFTEVGQIATHYNRVIDKVLDEMEIRDGIAQRLASAREAAETTKRKIVSSIEYAQRIQHAILPTQEFLTAVLPPHFIIYRPRDIVSGDFYWCLKRDESVYLAVVDCTGHGVPGAFMSMVGYMILQQIVVEKCVSEPADILTHMHRQVRSALGQDAPDSQNQDGMDVCLVRMDPDGIIFAGAHRPLWWIDSSNGTPKFGEIKGERHAIGGGRHQERDTKFVQHRLPRFSGFTIYLGTDGITDQPNHLRQPFDTSRLRSLLVAATTRSMDAQQRELEQALDAFQGGAAQRDDITLVGIQL